MFEAKTYVARREALGKALADRGLDRGLVLLPGNRDSPRAYADNPYAFRQDSSFTYFVGLQALDLAAILDLGSGEASLFGDDPSLEAVVWTGPEPSVAEQASRSGIARTASRASFAAEAKAAAAKGLPLLYLPPYRAETRAELAAICGMAYDRVNAGASAPLIGSAVALREIKSEEEAAELDAAVAISVEMHRAAMATARPGMRESDIAARVTQVAMAMGAGPSFLPIATTRGQTLHTRSYSRRLREGGLFLLDAGAETESGYAGDLSSTFPVGPRYTERQRAMYDIVLAGMKAASDLLGPGRHFREVHFAAARAMAEGLKGLGLMKGDLDEAIAAGAHALFFPHGVGHMIGLDVHDMEGYGEDLVGYGGEARSTQFGLRSLRLSKPLRPGMAHTVEPGLYFIPELIAFWKAERRFEAFIDYDRIAPWIEVGGIRNEENWLVTGTGARRLGPAFDKSPAAIEALRAYPIA